MFAPIKIIRSCKQFKFALKFYLTALHYTIFTIIKNNYTVCRLTNENSNRILKKGFTPKKKNTNIKYYVRNVMKKWSFNIIL